MQPVSSILSEENNFQETHSYAPPYQGMPNPAGLEPINIPHEAHPRSVVMDLSGRVDDSDETRREAHYINGIVDNINQAKATIPATPHEIKNRQPDIVRNPSNSRIAEAEIHTDGEIKKKDPSEHELNLYKAELQVSKQIEAAFGEEYAEELKNRIRHKAGELLQSQPDLPQTEAASLAITKVYDEDPSIEEKNPLAYGAVQTWARVVIKENQLADERVDALREEAKKSIYNS